MRVVSWAVVAVRVTTHPVHSPANGSYELLGTMTGTLQIGATVNDGEQFAINKLAEWVTTSVRSSSDSKVAINRCLKANIQHTLPQVWSTSLAQRELLQVSWTKGHLDAAQHCQRFGLENWWMWATNLEADMACSRKSAEVFSHQQANRTDCIDQAAREKFSLLGQRCADILASDPVPRLKEAKFEATPVAGRQAKPSGPNKRQRLLAATQGMNAHTGHNWVVTAAAKTLCIKCTVCSLYLVLSHPCKHRPAEPLATAGIHPSHLTLNLGHQWSCSRCKAHHSVRTRAKGPLSKECKGDRKKGGQKPSPAPRVSSGQVLLLYLLL